MRKLFLLLLTCLSAQAATVQFALTNYDTSMFTGTVQIFPVGDVNAYGAWTVVGLPKRMTTTNGIITTNLLLGNYELRISDIGISNILFAVPNDTSTNIYPVTTRENGGIVISGEHTYNYTPGVFKLTSNDGSVTLTPSSGIGTVDLHSVGGGGGGGASVTTGTNAVATTNAGVVTVNGVTDTNAVLMALRSASSPVLISSNSSGAIYANHGQLSISNGLTVGGSINSGNWGQNGLVGTDGGGNGVPITVDSNLTLSAGVLTARPSSTNTVVIDASLGATAATLTNALNSLQSNSRVMIRGPFTWPTVVSTNGVVIKAMANIHDVANVEIVGEGATLNGTGPGYLITVSNVVNLTVRGVTFTGDKTSGYNYLAGCLGFNGTNVGVTITDNVFTNWIDQALTMCPPNVYGTHQVHIERNRFYNVGTTNATYLGNVPDGTCMSSFMGNDIWVCGNYASNCLRFLEIENCGIQGSGLYFNWHINDNILKNHLGWFFIEASEGDKMDGIEVKGNIVSCTLGTQINYDPACLALYGGSNITIANNIFKNFHGKTDGTVGGVIGFNSYKTNSMDRLLVSGNQIISDWATPCPAIYAVTDPAETNGIYNLDILNNVFDGGVLASQATILAGASNLKIEGNTFRHMLQTANTFCIVLLNTDSGALTQAGRCTNVWVNNNILEDSGSATGTYFLYSYTSKRAINLLEFKHNKLNVIPGTSIGTYMYAGVNVPTYCNVDMQGFLSPTALGLVASRGSIYKKMDGWLADTLYIKESGVAADSSGWTVVYGGGDDVSYGAGTFASAVGATKFTASTTPGGFVGDAFSLTNFPFGTTKTPGTFYVSPTGLSSNSGLTAKDPWNQTNALAGGKTLDGATFIFMNGTYTALDITNTGVKIVAATKWGASISNAPTFGIAVEGTNVTIDGFHIALAGHHGIEMYRSNCIVQNCWIHDSGQTHTSGVGSGTYIASPNGWETIQYNLLENNGFTDGTAQYHGVYIQGGGNIARGNVCRYNWGAGISDGNTGVTNYYSQNLTYKNHFYAVAGSGFDSASKSLMWGNTFIETNYVFYTTTSTSYYITNCIVFGTVGFNAGSVAITGDHNLTNGSLTAGFVTPANGLYWLTSGSAARNIASTAIAGPYDSWSNLQSSVLDVGAFQYNVALSDDTRVLDPSPSTGADYWVKPTSMLIDIAAASVTATGKFVGNASGLTNLVTPYVTAGSGISVSSNYSAGITSFNVVNTGSSGTGVATNGGTWQNGMATNTTFTGSIGTTFTNLTDATGKTVISGPTATHTITNGPNFSPNSIELINSGTASSGNQFYSGSLHFQGQGWKTAATPGSQPVDWFIVNVPVQGTANPTTMLVISNIVNNAAPTEVAHFQSDNSLRMPQTGSIIYLGVNNNGMQLNGGGAIQGWGSTPILVGPQGSATINLQINGVNKWIVDNNSSFDIYPFNDNAADLGDATPHRVRTVHLSSSLTNSSAAGGTGMNFPAAGTGTDGAAAADLKINSAVGTGTGRGGAIRLQTANSATSTGSTANTLADRTYISAKSVTLTESSATLVFNVSLASGKTCGLRVFATTDADDATNFQVNTDTLQVSAVNKAGTVTTAISTIGAQTTTTAVSSGTLTTTWTAVANGNGVDVKCNAVSSLTQTTLATRWRAELDSDDTAISITAQ